MAPGPALVCTVTRPPVHPVQEQSTYATRRLNGECDVAYRTRARTRAGPAPICYLLLSYIPTGTGDPGAARPRRGRRADLPGHVPEPHRSAAAVGPAPLNRNEPEPDPRAARALGRGAADLRGHVPEPPLSCRARASARASARSPRPRRATDCTAGLTKGRSRETNAPRTGV